MRILYELLFYAFWFAVGFGLCCVFTTAGYNAGLREAARRADLSGYSLTAQTRVTLDGGPVPLADLLGECELSALKVDQGARTITHIELRGKRK